MRPVLAVAAAILLMLPCLIGAGAADAALAGTPWDTAESRLIAVDDDVASSSADCSDSPVSEEAHVSVGLCPPVVAAAVPVAPAPLPAGVHPIPYHPPTA